jgi:hypothetical protein
MDDNVDICRAWESSVESIKAPGTDSLGYYELKWNKPCSDVCSKLLYQRKQAKLQQLKKPNQINGNNLNSVRHETSRSYRNKSSI